MNSKDIVVIDDYLDLDSFNALKSNVFSPEFPVYYTTQTIDYEKDISTKELSIRLKKVLNNFDYKNNLEETKGICSFHHVFSWYRNYRSEDFEILNPLLEKLKPREVLRAKLNFTPPTEHPLISGWHLDVPEVIEEYSTSIQEVYTCVYCLTSNNGYTLMEDGMKIPSKANRFIKFPANILHTGVSHTNSEEYIRANININIL